MPGDPASAMFARFRGELHPEAMEALRAAYGMTDGPLPLQFLTYITHVVRGDFGLSVVYFRVPVVRVIGNGLGWTILVAGTALLVSFVLGNLIGVAAAARRGGVVDRYVVPVLAFIGAFPYFWLAMLMLFVFGFQLAWFPLRHGHSGNALPSASLAFIADVAWHAVLPIVTLVVATLSTWALGMRNLMLGVLTSDFVALARAKGLSERRVVFAYAARNALIPSITTFGMALGLALGGSLLTEIVFSYPGTGFLLVQAVRNQDYALMQGLFVTITAAVLIANALVDVMVAVIDPQTRRTNA